MGLVDSWEVVAHNTNTTNHNFPTFSLLVGHVLSTHSCFFNWDLVDWPDLSQKLETWLEVAGWKQFDWNYIRTNGNNVCSREFPV